MKLIKIKWLYHRRTTQNWLNSGIIMAFWEIKSTFGPAKCGIYPYAFLLYIAYTLFLIIFDHQ